MEEVKVSYTIRHKNEAIKINDLLEIRNHPIQDVLKKNLSQLEKKMYSEAATIIISNDYANKLKIDFK